MTSNELGLKTRLQYGTLDAERLYTDYTYADVTRWLTGVYNKKNDATAIISSFAYTHDLVGNRRTMSIDNNRAVITYTYNAAYELTSELRTGQDAYSIAWVYDGLGNRLSQNKGSVWTYYQCNDANQSISDTANSTTSIYQYDANGNLISKTLNSTTYIWTYNYENRQVAYNDPDNNKDASYVYDALGRRISKTLTVAGTTEKYVYDGDNIIVDYNGANVLQATYVTPFLDQNLLLVKGGTKYYYMQDGLGSVRNIMSAQSVRAAYDYYAFGEVFSESEHQTLTGQRYRYTSREWDAESSLYYYRARYDNPYIGRFLSADPLGYDMGINLYSYVRNNPANNTDPSGLIETTSVPNPTHSMLSFLMPICLSPAGGGNLGDKPKKCCGVETFEVKWAKRTDTEAEVRFRLNIDIEFKKWGDFYPECCEYRQYVDAYFVVNAPSFSWWLITDGWIDDGYSRANNEIPEGQSNYSYPRFKTSDIPGVDSFPKNSNVYISFSAEQVVFDICNNWRQVAKRGPHTAVARGRYPNREWTGVPATLKE